MKALKQFHTFRTSLAILTSLLFASCSFVPLQQEATSTETAASSATSPETVRLCVSASLPSSDTTSRTLLPDAADTSEVTEFVFTSTCSSTSETSTLTAETLSALNTLLEGESFSPVEYVFELQATLPNAIYTASYTTTLTSGENTIPFTLKPSSGYGGFSLTLTFSGDATRVTGKLCSPSDAVIIAEEELTVSGTDTKSIIFARTASELKDASVSSGYYRIYLSFFAGDDGDIPLNTYREIVCIAPGCTSSDSRTIDLNELYTITYYDVLDDGTITEIDGTTVTIDGSAPSQFSRKSAAITLSDAVCSGSVFYGWYTDSSFSAGSEITEIASGTAQDIAVYARWKPILTVNGTTYGKISSAIEAVQNAATGSSIVLYTPASENLGPSSTENTILYGLKTNTLASSLSLSVAAGETITVSSDCEGLFKGCTNLTSIDLTGFDTTGLTTMKSWFQGCTVLTDLNLDSIDTSSVTDMSSLFSSCSSLTTLNLDSFNTESVQIMDYLFMNCSSLTTISATDDFVTDSVTSGTGMFSGCTSLTGGSGTTYDASCVDHTYAHIDGGTSNPGYFTGLSSDVYVSSAGSDSNGGTSSDDAFATLSHAVSYITEKNLTTADWTIHISGNLSSVTADIDTSVAAAARSITISGTTNSTTDVLTGDSTNPILVISGDIPVAVENLTLLSGDGGILCSSGSLTVSGSCISKCTDSAIHISTDSDVTITTSSIGLSSDDTNYNTADYGAGIYKAGDGTLTISDSTIGYNKASKAGGGIYFTGGTLVLEDAANIIYNSVRESSDSLKGGGGIFAYGGIIKIQSGATISHNTANYRGGGISIAQGTKVTMNGGTISENSAGFGGGVMFGEDNSLDADERQDVEFTMSGGSISNNTANTEKATWTGFGGGAYIVHGSFVMTGSSASIDSNKAVYEGGGVYLSEMEYDSSFTMSSGTIQNNTAGTSGGAIYSKGEVTLSGGKISSNRASTQGGGIFNGDTGILCLSGTFVLGDDSVSSAASIDGYSNYASDCGGGIYNSGALYIGYSDEDTPESSYSGGIYYNYAPQGGAIYNSGDSACVTKIAAGYLNFNASGSDGGAIRLGGSGDRVEISGGTIHGNIANRSSTGTGGGAIYVGESSSVTCTGATISNNTAWNGGGIYSNGASVSIGEGVAIINNAANLSGSGKGGGIYNALNSDSGSLALTGGTIKNNTADGYGNGVYSEGNFIMDESASVDSSNDVYLPTDSVITLTETLSATSPVALITPQALSGGTAVLSGETASNHTKFELADSDWYIDSNGLLQQTGTPTGITITVPTYTNDDLELTASVSGTNYVFTAKAGYSSYIWTIDSTSETTTEATWSMSASGLSVGTHTLLLIATDSSGNSHEATTTITISE